MSPKATEAPAKRLASKESGTDSPYFIESLARGLAVLDSFSPARYELSLKDIAKAAGVTQASAVRIGYTLIETGYLVRNPITKGFRPGPHMIGAGLVTIASMTLPEIAEPYLLDLRDRSRETVKLAVPAKDEVVVVFRAPSRWFPPESKYIGTPLPYHTSSLGLAILAWLPTDVAEVVLSRADSVKFTARSLSVAQARKQTAVVRRRGYSLNDQGTTVEHRSVAAPLFQPDGQVVGSVNISVSAQRVSLHELEQRLAPQIVEAASAISATIPPDVQGAGFR